VIKGKKMNNKQQQDISVPDNADIDFLTQKINAETLQFGLMVIGIGLINAG